MPRTTSTIVSGVEPDEQFINRLFTARELRLRNVDIRNQIKSAVGYIF
jgi:hypothetical protein